VHQAVKVDAGPVSEADAQPSAGVQSPWQPAVVLEPLPGNGTCARCAEKDIRIAALEQQIATARLAGALELARAGAGGHQREVLDRLRAEAGVPVLERAGNGHQPAEPETDAEPVPGFDPGSIP
jgi:hypothetical protein